MMAVVALVGVALGLFVYARELRRRSARYEDLAVAHMLIAGDLHTGLQSFFLTYTPNHNGKMHRYADSDVALRAYDAAIRTHDDALRAHHERLSAKYFRAARYPWRPVEPDPPPPVLPPRPGFPDEWESPYDRDFGRSPGGETGAARESAPAKPGSVIGPGPSGIKPCDGLD